MNPDRRFQGIPKIGDAIRSAAAFLDRTLPGEWREAGLRLAALCPAPSKALGHSEPPANATGVEPAWQLLAQVGSVGTRRLGQFATPRPVALAMADALLDLGPTPTVADPACGTGNLLLACLERARDRDLRVPRFAGTDIDPVAVAICEAVLWLGHGGQHRDRVAVRDVIAEGLAIDPDISVIANPPWGTKVLSRPLRQWRERAGAFGREEMKGEAAAYALCLSEALWQRRAAAVFLTPIHWLHRRSLAAFRLRLARERRLRGVHVLRKGVFAGAKDMIPVITAWTGMSAVIGAERGITVRRCGLRAPLPLSHPLPVADESLVSHRSWEGLPHAGFPLLRSASRGEDGDRLMQFPGRLSDSEAPRTERWFHLGDGLYKTKVRDHLSAAGTGLPFLTKGSDLTRYRLASARSWISPAVAEATVGATDRRRFAGAKLVLHAMKKANARWRLCAALHEPGGAHESLGLTNNFLVLTAEAYRGDLRYPLALLNSRTFNRLYTDHFPGVNLEAYTVGALPFPWPVASQRYERILILADRMTRSGGSDRGADAALEAEIEALLQLPPGWAGPHSAPASTSD